MNYYEFKELAGELTVPREEHNHLLHREDSIHFVVRFGVVVDGTFIANDIGREHEVFIDAIKLIENRGAKRGNDYIVAGERHMADRKNGTLEIQIHTTKDFLSDEDFDENIKRYYSK